MTNHDLRKQLDQKERGLLTREQKRLLNHRVRGAFYSDFRSLTGNVHIGKAILRNGFDTPRQVACLLAEYYNYIDSPDYTQWLRDQEERSDSRRQLRQQALRARDDLKHAQWLQRQIKRGSLRQRMLTAWQKQLMQQHKRGRLERRRREANIAYGFGAGNEDLVLTQERRMMVSARSRGFVD